MSTWIGSPNFKEGRGGKKLSLIVVHHMAGTLAGTDKVFQDTNRNTSAHYGVGRNGEIHQYVYDSDTAFHAGNYDINQRSIGIEHEDLNADNYTELEYQTSAQLIRSLCSKYGLPINAQTVRPHRDFFATACPGTLDIGKLIALAKGDDMATDKLTREEIMVAHQGFFFQEAPTSTIDYYLGKNLSTMLTDFAASNERKQIEQTWAATTAETQLLKPGIYKVN